MKVVTGDPDPKHVSTSYVERQNWTVRTTMRRYTAPQQWILAQTVEPCGCDGAKLLRVQFHQDSSHAEDESGMAAGVTDRLWDVNDLGVPLEAYERRAERAA